MLVLARTEEDDKHAYKQKNHGCEVVLRVLVVVRVETSRKVLLRCFHHLNELARRTLPQTFRRQGAMRQQHNRYSQENTRGEDASTPEEEAHVLRATPSVLGS